MWLLRPQLPLQQSLSTEQADWRGTQVPVDPLDPELTAPLEPELPLLEPPELPAVELPALLELDPELELLDALELELLELEPVVARQWKPRSEMLPAGNAVHSALGSKLLLKLVSPLTMLHSRRSVWFCVVLKPVPQKPAAGRVDAPMLSAMAPPGARSTRPSSPLNEVTPKLLFASTSQMPDDANEAPELQTTTVAPGASVPVRFITCVAEVDPFRYSSMA